MTASPKNLKELLEHTKCSELVKTQNVIVIDSEASISEGCETLVKHSISSAPVYDKSTNSYIGMLDYRDIVDYVLLVFHKKRPATIDENNVSSSSLEVPGSTSSDSDDSRSMTINEIIRKAMSGELITMKYCSDLSQKNPFYSVMPESSLLTALQVLSGKSGVHRLNVVDSTSGKVTGVLSQTDIVKFISTKLNLLGSVGNKTVAELGLIDPEFSLVSVSCNDSVLDALSEMSKRGMSSIAVTNPTSGCLIGNISMTDIKYILKHGCLTRLWASCNQFLTMVLSQQGLENEGRDRIPVFDVNCSSKFEFAIKKIVVMKVHRLWIVDTNSMMPVGVLSLSDILRVILNTAEAMK